MKRWLIQCISLLILASSSLIPICSWAEDDQGCLGCHVRGSSKSKRHVDMDQLRKSVHWGAVSCVDCHPGTEDEAHQHRETSSPATCGTCHDQENRHGVRSGKSTLCSDCHGGHNVFPPADRRSTLHEDNLAGTCGRCHPEESGRGTVSSSIISFRIKAHGKGDLSRSYSEDRCLDCHHREANHDEPEPSTTGDCRECHNSVVSGTILLGTFHGKTPTPADVRLGRFGDFMYPGSLVVFLAVFSWGWTRKVRIWRRGKPARRWNSPGRRLLGMVGLILGQNRIFHRKMAGISHYLIFLGVTVPILFIFAMQANPTLAGSAAQIASLLLDLIGLGLLVGLALAFLRRIRQPNQFPAKGVTGTSILIILLLIVVTGFLIEGLRLAIVPADKLWSNPVGGLLSLALPSSPVAMGVMWRLHFLLVLLFLSVLPFTRLRHLLTVPLNIFFRNMGPIGRLEPVRVDSGERFGASYATDLTWKDLLDADSCVECGRCQEACPAYASGKPLSPMKVVLDVGSDAETCSPNVDAGGENQDLLHGRISQEEIWACTTCHACQHVCPVFVEHVEKLVGLRRALVMDDGRVPREAARLLRNLEVYGDPSGKGQALRLQWAQSLEQRSFADKPEGALLFWVGCQVAFHPRAQEMARAVVAIAQRAGVKLAILGNEEICCGDPSRRLGQEALFQEIATRNIERFKAYGVKEIVTLCPHCFNTLANEYSDFGADIQVIHAVEWTMGLLRSGKLEINRALRQKLTFHDPCYFSRVNDLFQLPRAIIKVISGLELQEMRNSGQETFCCGAGGGRMWLHETGIRVNRLRAEQCMQNPVDVVATACPYCVTMLEDGLNEVNSRQVKVQDIIEIVESVTR